MKLFPILGAKKYRDCPTHIPWEAIEPYQKRIMTNHGQSLERLAQRGGLAPIEIWLAVEDLAYGTPITAQLNESAVKVVKRLAEWSHV